MRHFLTDNSKKYPASESTNMPTGSTFDNYNGYWVDENNKPLITNDGFRGSATKKEDRETGEDQKGE